MLLFLFGQMWRFFFNLNSCFSASLSFKSKAKKKQKQGNIRLAADINDILNFPRHSVSVLSAVIPRSSSRSSLSPPCLLHFASPLISALLTFFALRHQCRVALCGFGMTPVIPAPCERTGGQQGDDVPPHTHDVVAR